MIETVIFMFFIGILISIFFIHIGYIEIVRLRLAMANCFMLYSQAHDINPNSGRALTDKVSLMLSNGPPIIKANSYDFGNINIWKKEQSVSIGNLKLPFGPTLVKSSISVYYNYNSLVIQTVMGGQKGINLGSGQLEQYKETLYKSFLGLDTIKGFF